MIFNIFQVLIGLVLLAAGGEAVVRGALAAARSLGMSPVLAGLLIVGFGTSAPELVVSIDAVTNQQPGIAVGNAIGSNISNVLLILSCCALVKPLTVSRRLLMRDGLVVLGAAAVFMLLAFGTELARRDGMVLLTLLAAYLVWAYRTEVRGHSAIAGVHAAEAEELQLLPRSTLVTIAVIVGGLALLIAGSRFIVDGGLGLGTALRVPPAVIGLTVVAVGTSLPEFAVCILATLRGHSDVAVGNILGSNIFNTLGILGVSAMLQPLPMAARIVHVDQWVMLGASVLLLGLLATGFRLSRREGGILLAVYVAYTTTMFATTMGAT